VPPGPVAAVLFWLILFAACVARELSVAFERPVPGNRDFCGLLLGDRVAAAGSLPRSQMLADFLKASLEVRSDCGPAREQGHCAASRASPDSQLRKWWAARRGGTVALSAKRPEPTPTRTFVAHQARWQSGIVGKAVLLVRVGQRRLTH